MISDIGSTVIQLEEKHKGQENGQKPTEPCSQHKQAAEFPTHDGLFSAGACRWQHSSHRTWRLECKFQSPHKNREK